MTDYKYADLIAFAEGSTRPEGKCLGFANNDVVTHFGKMGNYPNSAKQSADQLAAAGLLHTDECPSYPHVDFYDFVTKGVNLGHVDWHFPQHGVHVADSGRTTVKLNPSGTVGTYPSWGTRRGWATVPAVGAQISFVNDAGSVPPPAPSSGGHGHEFAVNLPTKAVQASIQKSLKGRGRYSGAADGVFGKNTWKAIQSTVSPSHGANYEGPIDGIPGYETCLNIQVYAQRYGGYKGPLDGILGPKSWAGFAAGVRI